jgi:hypothetical protein
MLDWMSNLFNNPEPEQQIPDPPQVVPGAGDLYGPGVREFDVPDDPSFNPFDGDPYR